MSQIYKVAHLKNNEIQTLYVFYGSKIRNNDYEVEQLQERFDRDKNDELFTDVFSAIQLKDLIDKDTDVKFVDMKIHRDDTIEAIKTKILYANMSEGSFSFYEMYLFVKHKRPQIPEKIYENLTQNNSTDLSRLHLEQYLHNINKPELISTLANKDVYEYDDIVNLKLIEDSYVTNKSIDQKIVVKDTNYPYFVNPYDITEIGEVLDNSQENMTTTTNNSLLMSFGEFENDIIYMCLTKDVIETTNAKNLSEESCIKIYFPKLYDKNITSLATIETSKETLSFVSKNMVSERFLVKEHNINLLIDIHNAGKIEEELTYEKRGITSIDLILHPPSSFNLPLDVVFKLINTTEDILLTKYNPGKSQEKMYRLHTSYTATNGKKIPTLPPKDIFRLMKDIGKSKSVAVYTQFTYKDNMRNLVCEFNSNGDVTIKIEGFIDINDIDKTILNAANPIIDKIKSYISQGGYNMNNFVTIHDDNVEINNIDYHTEIPVTRKLNIESVNNCISGVFIVSNFDISKGIEMRFKRVENYDEMSATEALIMDLINKGLSHTLIIDNLVANFNISNKEAIANYNEFMNSVDIMQNDFDSKKFKIKNNPGFQIFITKDNKNNIFLDVSRIDKSIYLKTIELYLDALMRITQNPDLISKCKSVTDINDDDIEPDMTADLISEAEQINKKTDINDGAIKLAEDVEYDDMLFGDDSEEESDEESEDDSDSEGVSLADIEGGADVGYDMDLENLKLRDYFAERMKTRDKNLFMVKGEGNINSYSRSCPSHERRQPVILTDAEKTKIDREHPGSYGEAIEYGSSPANKHWYICPRYWNLKNNVSLTEKSAKSGKYGAIIPLKAKKVSNGEEIFEFKSAKQLDPATKEYKAQYPGFLKKQNGVCAPCCFGGPEISKAQEARREICSTNNETDTTKPKTKNKKIKLKPTVKEKETTVPDTTVPDTTVPETTMPDTTNDNVKKKADIDYYVKGADKFPLDNNRFGYLPVSIERFLNTKNKQCYISETNTNLKPNHPCVMRLGVESNSNQSFVACIAKIWANRPKGGGIENSPTIVEMKQILIDSIDYDVFVGLQNGNLINIFGDSTANVDLIEMEKLKDSKIYNGLKSDDPEKIKFFNKVVSAYGNFVNFINNPNVTIDHTYLWDLICTPNSKLFKKGLNMIILDIPNDDMTNKVDILCPSNNYSDNFFDVGKDIIMLIRKKEGKNKKDDIYFETIIEMKEKKEKKIIATRINMNGDNFEDIKSTIRDIKRAYSKCNGISSVPRVYTFKKNIILSALVSELKDNDYKIIAQIFNYDGKVIAVKTEINGKVGILPCYPSAPMIGDADDIEYIWIDTIIGETYEKTIDYLLNLKGKSDKILCKPMVNVKEDGIIVGVITETNQFVPVKPEPDYVDTNYKGVDKTITTNNFNEIDTIISTDSSVDIERIEYIKKINLETGFYKIFRNTIRIMLSEHNNKSSRTDIESIIASDKQYNNKLRAIIKILQAMTNNYFKFSDFSKVVINDISNVVSCYKNDDLLDKKYCIIDDSTKEKRMMIPKVNLINQLDNEVTYFGKLADELLRFNRIKTFIFEPKSFLSLGDIGYNLGDDEIVLMQSLLNKEYFVDIEKEVTNEYIKTNTFDVVNPLKTENYTSSFNKNDFSNSPKKSKPKKTNSKIKLR